MKRKLLSSGLFVILLGFAGFSQSVTNLKAYNRFEVNKGTPTLKFAAPDMAAIQQEDIERDRNGMYYRIGVSAETNITSQNSGSWITRQNGDRVWQLHVKYTGAEALSFLFATFKIYDQSSFNVFDNSGQILTSTLTKDDVLDHFQKHIPLCFGDEMTLELTEPAGSRASEILIDGITYNYRSTGNPNASVQKINESGNCEINVNCSPVGDAWQDEKRGVARIIVVGPSGSGYCTGSLVNNTAQDCKPLFLTAQHCAVGSTTTQFNQWVFNFAYEAPTCSSPASTGTLLASSKRIDGCVLLSKSDGVTGQNTITSSDFVLVQLGSLATEATVVTKLKTAAINAYWNGWDANNIVNTGGAGIHHPAGDIKKISTYSGALVSTNYSSGGSNTHWRVTWSSNSNGTGVTEGGSSGSPIFNTNGGNSRIIGTLSGGSSQCSALSAPDLYGKMSYHWASNGTTENKQLQPFLDPTESGVLVMNGSSNPCGTVVVTAPVANFSANMTTVSIGGTVAFTDLSTNTPTSWSWSVTPSAGVSYAAGTSSTSQNPQMTFTVAGQYTIALTASNSAGSDTETKTNYITVTVANSPCTATASSVCDEFISNVSLGAINNSSSCSSGYASYAATATLTKGQQYTITITPSMEDPDSLGAYSGDEIAAYIDWNGNFDFTDAGDRVAFVHIAGNWNNQFTFTVPTSAVSGMVKMRVRIAWNGSPSPEGAIQPCGTTVYGEVEDYNITILPAVAGVEELNALEAVSIYPNPVSDQLTVDFSSLKGNDVSVELIDLTGKVLAVRRNAAGTVAQFDMTGFAKGAYQVRMKNGNVYLTQKIIRL